MCTYRLVLLFFLPFSHYELNVFILKYLYSRSFIRANASYFSFIFLLHIKFIVVLLSTLEMQRFWADIGTYVIDRLSDLSGEHVRSFLPPVLTVQSLLQTPSSSPSHYLGPLWWTHGFLYSKRRRVVYMP